MWFFFRRWRERQHAQAQAAKPRPLSFEQITHGFGNFSDFKSHDTALKFWLPEPAEQALVEFCGIADQSLSEWLRQFFAVYAYGLYALSVMHEHCPGMFRDQMGPLYSKKTLEDPPPGKKRVYTYWVPELGKNVVPIKVWIPARMKNDLQILADHAGVPLSQLAREIVISRLLGHGTLPARPILTHAEPTAADGWCEDLDVPWREVDEGAYRYARERDTRWHYEDATGDEESAAI